MTLNSRAQDLTIGGRTRGRAQVQLFATLTTESDLFQIKGATSCLDGMQIRGAKEAQVYSWPAFCGEIFRIYITKFCRLSRMKLKRWIALITAALLPNRSYCASCAHKLMAQGEVERRLLEKGSSRPNFDDLSIYEKYIASLQGEEQKHEKNFIFQLLAFEALFEIIKAFPSDPQSLIAFEKFHSAYVAFMGLDISNDELANAKRLVRQDLLLREVEIEIISFHLRPNGDRRRGLTKQLESMGWRLAQNFDLGYDHYTTVFDPILKKKIMEIFSREIMFKTEVLSRWRRVVQQSTYILTDHDVGILNIRNVGPAKKLREGMEIYIQDNFERIASDVSNIFMGIDQYLDNYH